ncbi:aminodeoxychorismate lyase [Halomonas sp. TRM85114]|uniref:aminodeoxychorismate lyase n=1 Tax=Halomonas jincaotanensis TaxID=2810616 RepID=UPI001BD54C87|nr:aminodeoxychorismate lyase [Halomonas jincaotanensis]MBS9402133.1 aminodeoxychorismate lyase [Halomonas jincaotanensis]
MTSRPESWPLDDRGAAYGDGLFETVLLRDGEPQLWDAHLGRLAKGCEVLAIPLPARAALEEPLAAAGKGLQVLKLMLTRGSGGRGYQLPAKPEPRLRWRLAPFVPMSDHWASGVRIRHCALRLGIQPTLAGLKHLNRLENVLARAEWSTPKVAEGVLCDAEGRLVEATCMNLFWQRHGRLETPRLDRCGVAGTLREALRQRVSLHEVESDPAVLENAEAVWLGNSLQGLWPVARLDDAQGRELMRWKIGPRHRPLQAEAHALLGHPLFT